MYTVNRPKVEITSLSDSMDILKSWVDSRSKFLEIRELAPYMGMSQYDIYNHETKEVVDSDINHYLKDVMKMDLAFNYFQNAIFKMTTSVFIREFFYTFNEVKAKWATTQRYSTQKEMIASSEAVLDKAKVDKAFKEFEEYTDKYNKGEITQFDHVREKMPLAYQVNYQFSCPVKQFIKMCSSLLSTVGESSVIWREFYASLYEAFNTPELKYWLDNLSKYLGTDECTKYTLTRNDCYSEDIIKSFNHVTVGPVLYSQLIRHEGLTVLGYPEFMKRYISDNSVYNCSHEFPIVFHASKSRILQIIRTRTEWFAVYDDWNSHNTWAAILREFIPEGADVDSYKRYLKVFNDKGEYDVTLAGVHDVDDSLRLHKGYTAYLPNALVLEDRSIVEERIKRYGHNPVTDMYLQMFDKGYVKDNPNNPYRIKWNNLKEDK